MEDAAGTPVVTKYYTVAGQRVALDGPDGLQYILTDHLGSVSAITDDTGALLSEQRYLPFGSARLDALAQTDFSYTGQRALDAVGLMDYNARWYKAGLGRFTQPDAIVPEIGSSQSFNRYSYTLNNPVRFSDPSGHRVASGCGPYGDGECKPSEMEIIQNNQNEAMFNTETAKAKCKAGNRAYCSGWENTARDIGKPIDDIGQALDDAGDLGDPGYDQYDLDADYCSAFTSFAGPTTSGSSCWLNQHGRLNPDEVYWTKAGVDFIGVFVPEAKLPVEDIDTITAILDVTSIILTADDAGRNGVSVEHLLDLLFLGLSRITVYGQVLNLASALNEVSKGYYFDLSGY